MIFKFNQALLTKNLKLLQRDGAPGDKYYTSSCPLFLQTVLGELQTETKVHTFMINGVKKFQVQTDATFNVCNDDPAVLTARFIHTGDTLNMDLPLTTRAVDSNKPNHKPSIKISARGRKRTVEVSTELPVPTNLRYVNSLRPGYTSDEYVVLSNYYFEYTYSSDNSPSRLLYQVYQGTYGNPTNPGVYNVNAYYTPLKTSGQTYVFSTSDTNPLQLNTTYVVQVRAETDSEVSPFTYCEYTTPGIANLRVENNVELADNKVQSTFAFEYTYDTSPQTYSVMLYEGTYNNITTLGNFNLLTYNIPLLESGDTNEFKSLAESSVYNTEYLLTPLTQNTQYTVIVTIDSTSEVSYYEFITPSFY
jgi:hypothetical protein